MELVEGSTLRDYLNEKGSLTVEQTFQLITPVLSALSAAHRIGIIHRDIKPENILISKDGRIKVADFGLARNITMGQTMTAESSVVLGSVSYLSPEQVQRGVADARSDIYAVGIVLFEMLTGSKPYSGETPIQIAYRHVNDRIPNIQTIKSEIPTSIAELVYEATAPNPDQRPKNAEELLNILREIQAKIDPKRRQMSLELDLPPIVNKKNKRGKVSVTSALGGIKEKTSQLISTKPINISKPEDSIRTKKRKVSRRVRRNRIIALFLLIALIFGSYQILNAGKISVPSLVGMSQGEAKNDLKNLGLNIQVVEEVFSEDVAKGKIIATKPGGGGKISPAGTVGLIVSKGQERIIVPTLNGLTPDVASGKISDLGLSVGQINESFDMKVAAGFVIGTDPKDGSEVRRKSIVNLIVSKGVEQLALPSYVGKGGEQALSELNDLGFDVNVKYSFSDSIFKGQVITQRPERSDLISKGSKIELEISKGSEFVFVPNVLGKNKNDASVDLENLGLKVSTKGSGKVNNISPAIGSKVKQGTVITITLR
jgi:serine/threonine-protein kinase